jgi:membrane protein YqaA with SNARE-associated domain
MKLNKPLAVVVLTISILLPILIFVYRDYFIKAQSLGLLGIFLINFSSNLSPFPEPGFVSVIAGGAIYNPILVAFAGSLGASFGDLLFYFIGHSGRQLALKRLRKKLLFRVIEESFKKHGGYIIFFAALIPNPFFDAFGLIGGIFGFSFTRFLLLLTLGRFLRFLLLAGFGSFF